MSDLRKFVQTQPTTLYGSGAVLGATSVIVSSLADLEGNLLTMTDFGTLGYGTIEPGTSGQEEAITFTGVTQNANGTATLTGVKNQLGKAPYTETSGLLKSHAGGTILVLSNTAGFYDAIGNKNNDETIVGTYTFTAPNYPRMDSAATPPTDDVQMATKKYVDDTAIAGAAKATDSVYGIAKLSSAMVDPTAPVVLNNEEVSATSAANKVVKANASGKIDKGFIEVTADKGLEFATNALQVKAGTGITCTAAGVNVDVGTTNGKIVQVTTGDKLPVIDGSNLTNVPPASSKVIQGTRDATGASGAVTYAHGLGKTPVKVTAFMAGTSASQCISNGFFDGTSNKCTWQRVGGGEGNAAALIHYDEGTPKQSGSVTTLDATNVTITWTETSNPSSGTLYFTLIVE